MTKEEVRAIKGVCGMTGKRFTLAYETNDQNCIWWAVRNGDITLWKEEVVDLLNELHEENQYLKSLKWNQDCIKEISISIQQRQLLERENEKLRKENMEYYHLVNCGNCKYHNYDWFDDGDEFEVCEKGHTERLMYNKFCKEWREL